MKEFNGEVLFLDRSDINTDEIIPAKYLTEIEKKALKPHLFEDLTLEGFDPKTDINGKTIIVTKENFGCGSSREHAPWVLEENNISLVIATGFARIFRQNMFNCGLLAIELPDDKIDSLFNGFSTHRTRISVDMDTSEITCQSEDQTRKISFHISEFDRALIQAGGWVNYADKNY